MNTKEEYSQRKAHAKTERENWPSTGQGEMPQKKPTPQIP